MRKLILIIFVLLFFEQICYAESGMQSASKDISGREYIALSVAYYHALPLLKKRSNIISDKIEDLTFSISENEKDFRIFILSNLKEVRGGDLEYWISKSDFQITRFKQWK